MTDQGIIYVRASRDRYGAGVTIARQERECREEAGRRGIVIDEHAGKLGVFADNDLSAYSGKRRKGYEAMLAYIAAFPRDIVCWHTDRLHRSPRELEDYITATEKAGASTYAAKAGLIDLATPSGRLVARQLGAVARFESEHMSERILAQKDEAAGAGLWLGGRRPYGFSAENGVLTVDLDEAAVVLWLAEQLLAGAAVRWCVRDLNDRGITTSTGARWTAWALRNMLLRPGLAGLMVHRKEIVGHASWGGWLDEGKTEWGAILSEARWRALRSLLKNPSRKVSPPSWVRRHLGSGLYLCGICGRPVRCTGSPGALAYRCVSAGDEVRQHVSRDAELLDGYVTGIAVELIAARAGQVDAAVPSGAGAPDPEGLRRKLNHLAEQYAADEIDAEQLATGTRMLRPLLALAEDRAAQAAAADPLAAFRDPAWDSLPADGRRERARQVWHGLTIPQRQAVVRAVMVVRVLPSPRGKPPGWKPRQRIFRPECVKIEPVSRQTPRP